MQETFVLFGTLARKMMKIPKLGRFFFWLNLAIPIYSACELAELNQHRFRHCRRLNARQAGIKTIPNQGSRALLIPQTWRGSVSALSKPTFTSKFSFAVFFNIHKIRKLLYRSKLKIIKVCTNLQRFRETSGCLQNVDGFSLQSVISNRIFHIICWNCEKLQKIAGG